MEEETKPLSNLEAAALVAYFCLSAGTAAYFIILFINVYQEAISAFLSHENMMRFMN
jgi:hypothetical protein